MSDKSGNGPSVRDTFMEAGRAFSEFVSLKSGMGTLRNAVPDGDGKSVIVLPGFGMADFSTSDLRNFLKGKGYKAYGWENGMNTGPNPSTLEHMRTQLERVYAENGNRKVALIGHSLGGIYARELAREFPALVDQVITLGTPSGADLDKNVSIPSLRVIFEALNPKSPFLHDAALIRRGIFPPPVPVTSIYSQDDGIVAWRACLNPSAPNCENVEIGGSHTGLVFNSAAFIVVADRLAQSRDSWKPFDATRYLAYSSQLRGQGVFRDAPPELADEKPAKPLFRKDP